ncbi:pyrrolidone-carboxylate peptidase [Tetragenococcus halophilus subsp. flandriensis]|uniref:pyroglutamyl-peptidase I n=1 Tax=Tetragenococcus halophilus TaxID=51669 RepID=UPI0023E99B9D|nr:pyroglutamyl-peptidase I [Tetragenococcus halophilus]GMA08216.1 pyrrolidone-carboxylate peptidase [Tetragenococcus halophilus subsp. flandriensis]
MKILVTGFDPFGGEKINPAWEAVKKLPDTIKEAQIVKEEIPTVYHKSADICKQAIQIHQPDIVLNIGQAGGRFTITPERIAINVDDARIPDNEENQPIDQTIQTDGQAAYFTQLPVKAMVENVRNNGFPAAVSNSAGTFVCNHIMYQVQYMIDKEFPNMKGGFIHVPFIAEQVVDKPNQPFMQIADIAFCIEKAIEAIVSFEGKDDLEAIGGEIH